MFGAEAVAENDDYQQYNNMERITLNDLEVGTLVTGQPVIHLFENDEPDKNGKPKNYDNIRVRIVDVEADEYIDAYLNIPKNRQNIKKTLNFYRSCFDFIHSTFCVIDDANATDEEGNPINSYRKINIDSLIDFLNAKEEITIKVTEGANGYNSLIVKNFK